MRQETETGDGRQEIGDRRLERGDRRHETGDRRGRQETEDKKGTILRTVDFPKIFAKIVCQRNQRLRTDMKISNFAFSYFSLSTRRGNIVYCTVYSVQPLICSVKSSFQSRETIP